MTSKRTRIYRRRKGRLRYYSQSSAHKKWILRVTILLLCIVLSVGFAILLGNYLKQKVESLPHDTDNLVSDDPPTTSDHTSLSEILPDLENMGSVQSTTQHISPQKIKGELLAWNTPNFQKETLQKSFKDLASSGYSAVAVFLTDESGNWLYSSDIIQNISRVPGENGNTAYIPDITLLREINQFAEKNNLIVSALLVHDFSSLVSFQAETDALVLNARFKFDCAVIKELQESGIDEIILCNYTFPKDDVSLFTQNIAAIVQYIQTLHQAADSIRIGVSLPTFVYQNVKYTPALEVLSEKADFLAMDLYSSLDLSKSNDELHKEVSDTLSSLTGTISLYNPRLLLPGHTIGIRTAVLDALSMHGVDHWQFMHATTSSS